MGITAHGKIHGKTIELDSELAIPDGADVEVTVVITGEKTSWGEGIKRSAGAASKVAGFEEAFEQVANERKSARHRESNS